MFDIVPVAGGYDMFKNVETAIRYRNKSEEVRVIAEDMRSEKAKEFLMGVATDYLKMADMVEHMPNVQAILTDE
ncbi:MAG TPA: hypothetical protein VKB67_02220 [Rhizomicrobium sp.]|nr:hypothetical protein [Rhizomicrobium sp.]